MTMATTLPPRQRQQTLLFRWPSPTEQPSSLRGARQIAVVGGTDPRLLEIINALPVQLHFCEATGSVRGLLTGLVRRPCPDRRCRHARHVVEVLLINNCPEASLQRSNNLAEKLDFEGVYVVVFW
eukprot:m.460019 g.460019  ORF g.460019 m.460019 type:complete len:125 (+) comp21906_c0_seq1:1099-1473(+)